MQKMRSTYTALAAPCPADFAIRVLTFQQPREIHPTVRRDFGLHPATPTYAPSWLPIVRSSVSDAHLVAVPSMRVMLLEAIQESRSILDHNLQPGFEAALFYVAAHIQAPDDAARTLLPDTGPHGYTPDDIREHLADCMDVASHVANLAVTGPTHLVFYWWLRILSRKVEHLCWMHLYYVRAIETAGAGLADLHAMHAELERREASHANYAEACAAPCLQRKNKAALDPPQPPHAKRTKNTQ